MAQTMHLALFGPVFNVVDVVMTGHTDNVTKPTTCTVETHTSDCRYGFPQVQVWVALENPRVACDTP